MAPTGLLSVVLPESSFGYLTAISLLPVIWFSGLTIYNLYFHPLRHYPGPWFTAASRGWWLYWIFQGQLSFKIKELHDQYGEVIRIAPNELSYVTPEAWKEIYGHRHGVQENIKDPNENFDDDTTHPSIIGADRHRHSQLRKLLSNAFSEKTLREQEPVMQQYVGKLIESLHKVCEGGKASLDMVSWYNYTTFDMIGHLSFDESFDCLSNSNLHPWIKLIFSSNKYFCWVRGIQRIPGSKSLLRKLIPKSLVEKKKQNMQIIAEKVARRRERTPSYTDFMTHLIQAEQKGQLEIQDLNVNAMIIIAAGSETTATLLSGVTYYLLTNPRCMALLVNEVRSAFTSEAEINLSGVNSLKYMLACLDEALRMYPPAATSHPRRTPPEGATIRGRFVPGHCAMGMNQLAVHRSAANWTDPDVFVPERFLGDPRYAGDKREALQPFSVGPRNCIGRNLAYVEMRLVLCRVLWNFDMEMVGSVDGKDWIDQYIWAVWEKKPLMVRLKPVVRG